MKKIILLSLVICLIIPSISFATTGKVIGVNEKENTILIQTGQKSPWYNKILRFFGFGKETPTQALLEVVLNDPFIDRKISKKYFLNLLTKEVSLEEIKNGDNVQLNEEALEYVVKQIDTDKNLLSEQNKNNFLIERYLAINENIPDRLIQKDYEISQKMISCPDTKNEVCGENGATYLNECYALLNGVDIACYKECPCFEFENTEEVETSYTIKTFKKISQGIKTNQKKYIKITNHKEYLNYIHDAINTELEHEYFLNNDINTETLEVLNDNFEIDFTKNDILVIQPGVSYGEYQNILFLGAQKNENKLGISYTVNLYEKCTNEDREFFPAILLIIPKNINIEYNEKIKHIPCEIKFSFSCNSDQDCIKVNKSKNCISKKTFQKEGLIQGALNLIQNKPSENEVLDFLSKKNNSNFKSISNFLPSLDYPCKCISGSCNIFTDQYNDKDSNSYTCLTTYECLDKELQKCPIGFYCYNTCEKMQCKFNKIPITESKPKILLTDNEFALSLINKNIFLNSYELSLFNNITDSNIYYKLKNHTDDLYEKSGDKFTSRKNSWNIDTKEKSCITDRDCMGYNGFIPPDLDTPFGLYKVFVCMDNHCIFQEFGQNIPEEASLEGDIKENEEELRQLTTTTRAPIPYNKLCTDTPRKYECTSDKECESKFGHIGESRSNLCQWYCIDQKELGRWCVYGAKQNEAKQEEDEKQQYLNQNLNINEVLGKPCELDVDCFSLLNNTSNKKYPITGQQLMCLDGFCQLLPIQEYQKEKFIEDNFIPQTKKEEEVFQKTLGDPMGVCEAYNYEKKACFYDQDCYDYEKIGAEPLPRDYCIWKCINQTCVATPKKIQYYSGLSKETNMDQEDVSSFDEKEYQDYLQSSENNPFEEKYNAQIEETLKQEYPYKYNSYTNSYFPEEITIEINEENNYNNNTCSQYDNIMYCYTDQDCYSKEFENQIDLPKEDCVWKCENNFCKGYQKENIDSYRYQDEYYRNNHYDNSYNNDYGYIDNPGDPIWMGPQPPTNEATPSPWPAPSPLPSPSPLPPSPPLPSNPT